MKNFGFGGFLLFYSLLLFLFLFRKNEKTLAEHLYWKLFPKKPGGIGIPEIKRKPNMPKIDFVEKEE
jgi:hypothetical protein